MSIDLNPVRLGIMMKAYKNMYYSTGKTAELNESKLKDIVTAIYQTLEPIPNESLEKCFVGAVRNNQMPGSFQILKEWDSLKWKHPKDSAGNGKYGEKDFTGVWLPYGVFYNWMTLPRACRSDRMLELHEAYIKGSLSDDQAVEWESITQTKWDAHEVSEHPDYTARIKRINQSHGFYSVNEIVSKAEPLANRSRV